jgi:hypothetical protein
LPRDARGLCLPAAAADQPWVSSPEDWPFDSLRMKPLVVSPWGGWAAHLERVVFTGSKDMRPHTSQMQSIAS